MEAVRRPTSTVEAITGWVLPFAAKVPGIWWDGKRANSTPPNLIVNGASTVELSSAPWKQRRPFPFGAADRLRCRRAATGKAVPRYGGRQKERKAASFSDSLGGGMQW